MKTSNHANLRSQQRGIPKDLVDLILEYGTPKRKPGGAIEYIVHNKDKNLLITHLRRLINKVDKVDKKGILVKNGKIITIYHLM